MIPTDADTGAYGRSCSRVDAFAISSSHSMLSLFSLQHVSTILQPHT